jgi:hypothetical protein
LVFILLVVWHRSQTRTFSKFRSNEKKTYLYGFFVTFFSLNSADSTPLTVSTSPSDDEDDTNEHHQFLTPSSNLNSTTIDNGVVTPHMVVKINNNDNDSEDLDDISYAIQPSTIATTTTTLSTPQLHTHSNLSAARSETSLARPLLNGQYQTSPDYTLPITNEDERATSSVSSTSASTTSSTASSTSSVVPGCNSYITLYFTDMLISAFIITPFVNIHWRGAWDLLDIHFLPESPKTSALSSMGIGFFMLYIMYLTQDFLQKFYDKNRHSIVGQIMTRLYTLILALAYINQWRGLWNLLDLTNNEYYYLLGETGVSIIFLLIMKAIFNLNSAPFLIGIDTEYYFSLDSKYTVTVSDSNKIYKNKFFSFFNRQIVFCNIHLIFSIMKLLKRHF